MLTQKVYPILVILSIAGLLAQPVFAVATTTQTIGIPVTLGEVWSLIARMFKLFPSILGGTFQDVWQTWGQMAGRAFELWNRYIWFRVETAWYKLLGVFGRTVDERKLIIGQELQKEKKEVQQEFQQQAEKSAQGMWTRIKDFVKSKF